IDNVQRNLFTQQEVGERFGQLLTELIAFCAVLFVDLFDLTTPLGRAQFFRLGVDTAGDLDIHNDALDTGWYEQGSILHVRGLFTEDRTKQLLFRSQLGFTLWSDLTDKNISWLNLG